MSRMKTDAIEFVTTKTLSEVVDCLRRCAYECKAQVDDIESNSLDNFGGQPDIQVVFSGHVSLIGSLKHFRPGSAHNSWGVQIFVTDLGAQRHVEMIALGEGVFAGGLGNGSGVLNLGVSIDNRDKIAACLV